jgi:hypothetical protein
MLATETRDSGPDKPNPNSALPRASGPTCRLKDRHWWHERPIVEAYLMGDLREVARRFDAHPDIYGNARIAWAWVEERASELHTWAVLTPVNDDLLLVEVRSEKDARHARDRLRRVAGRALATDDTVVVRIGSVPDDWR